MPEKEGAEEKSTKSVVNKKQKLGEEGYDIARDMGRVRPSKDKKDATTMPPSKEMRKTQKVNKGPSALERVKAKYGKAVMDVGKKKANEELDLTKVAEAFGGYIIEKKSPEELASELQKRREKKFTTGKPQKVNITPLDKELNKIANQQTIDKLRRVVSTTAKTDPIDDKELAALGKTGAKVQREIETETGRKTRKFTPASGTGLPTDADDATIGVAPGEKAAPVYSFRIGAEREGPVAKARREKAEAEAEAAAKRSAAASERKRGRPVGAKDKTQRYVAKNPSKKDEVLAAMTPGQRARNLRRIQKDIDDRNPTIQTQAGPVPYRNRRVSKTRSLVPQYDRTPEIMKPDTDELLKFKDFRKKTKTTTAELDKEQEFKAPPIPQPQPEGGGGDDDKKPPKKTGTGESGGSRAFNSIKKFAKDNPAAALATYDIGKGILGKIKKYSKAAIKSLNVEKPTKTGRISAGQ